jgi:phosphatidylglycerol:prolipoprotein diacylglycerol transferase
MAPREAVTFPVFVPVGPWVVHPHVFFETMAYLVGFRLYLWLRRRQGDPVDNGPRWSIVTAAAIGAVIGSRLLFWLEDPVATIGYLHRPGVLLGGKTVVGALLGGWVAVEIVKRRIGIREATGDLFAVPLAVGLSIGRIGCFLSGLPDGTYGSATTLAWGVDLGDGLLRHPVALYESAFMMILASALWRTRNRLRRGESFKVFMASYLAFRIGADSVKPGVSLGLGLTAIQWACAGGLAYYAWWLIVQRPGEMAETTYPTEART